MIEQLRSAGDQLRAAWDNYYQVCSNIRHHHGSTIQLNKQLDTELAFISSLEPKIHEIKHAIRLGRNYAPINCLPPEILIRIFHFVLVEPCGVQMLSPDDPQFEPSRYPEYFTQVCALWRKAALSSHLLWCHIDLSPSLLHCTRLTARAWTSIERTGNLPIILHIGGHDYDAFEEDLTYEDRHELSEWLWTFGDRVKTLRMSIPGDLQAFHHTVFRELFPVSNLTKLDLESIGSRHVRFIVPQGVDLNGAYERLELDIPYSSFETALARITVLHLREIFLPWSSSAYRGLVDLRLISWAGDGCRISETELRRILHSSPKLRILHFGLEIHGSTPATREPDVPPVHLEDLSVLKIFQGHTGEAYSYYTKLLRILAPGTKPLALCLSGESVNAIASNRELERFFSRSRVTRFCSQHIFLPVRSLLRHATQLEHVLLDGFGFYEVGGPSTPSIQIQLDDLASFPRLKSLDVTRSILSKSELKLLMECCPTGITLHSSEVKPDSGGVYPLTEERRAEDFPNVKISDRIIQGWEDPTDDWDTLG